MANAEREAIHRILQSSQIPTDAVLLVHSAIKGLSRQGFKAEVIIESMLGYLSEGTLLMPTMSWRTVTPENPVFDELATPSHTGVLTEIFRTKYATHRSLHPTHSVAGCGSNAKTLLSTHHLGNTPVPASSPYGLMRDYPAYILLLGVGFEMCTAIHHPEEVIAPDIYVKPISEAEHYELRAGDGRVINYQLRRHKRLDRKFSKYETSLAQAGLRYCGNLAGVNWTLVRANDLYREVFRSLVASSKATIN